MKCFSIFVDPIGASTTPQARSEYETYLQDVFIMMIAKKCSQQRITEYLITVQRDNLGIKADEKKCKMVAELLFE